MVWLKAGCCVFYYLTNRSIYIAGILVYRNCSSVGNIWALAEFYKSQLQPITVPLWQSCAVSWAHPLPDSSGSPLTQCGWGKDCPRSRGRHSPSHGGSGRHCTEEGNELINPRHWSRHMTEIWINLHLFYFLPRLPSMKYQSMKVLCVQPSLH